MYSIDGYHYQLYFDLEFLEENGEHRMGFNINMKRIVSNLERLTQQHQDSEKLAMLTKSQ